MTSLFFIRGSEEEHVVEIFYSRKKKIQRVILRFSAGRIL